MFRYSMPIVVLIMYTICIVYFIREFRLIAFEHLLEVLYIYSNGGQVGYIFGGKRIMIRVVKSEDGEINSPSSSITLYFNSYKVAILYRLSGKIFISRRLITTPKIKRKTITHILRQCTASIKRKKV